jgi:LPS export ABC transporter protein LptC
MFSGFHWALISPTFGSVNASMNKSFHFKKYYQQAAILLGCLFFFSCENDPEKVRQLSENRATVEEAKNIETIMSEGGKLKAHLTAPYMIRVQADTIYVEFPKTLAVDFFDSTGKAESHVTALYGKYFESFNKVFLRDSVVVTNIKGDTLRTPELWWDQGAQKIYTDKKVRLHMGTGDKIVGLYGLDAKQDLSEIEFREASGVIIPKDSTAKQ